MATVRNGVVVVVHKELNGTPRYAVLKRVKNWEGWELVKGHRNEDEDVVEAAEREVEEETGIDTFLDTEPLDLLHEWTYTRDGEEIHAKYAAVRVEVPEDAYISVSENPHDEHGDGYFLNKRDAVAMLTHENQERLVETVHSQVTVQ